MDTYKIKEFEGHFEVVFGTAEREMRSEILDFLNDKILYHHTDLSQTFLFFTCSYHLLLRGAGLDTPNRYSM